ncbi:hypothetical protein DIPPA_06872 [Diplonema papillatum]|nr:hypothetical protein DIPPA_06872 [Diplonema papillatum]
MAAVYKKLSASCVAAPGPAGAPSSEDTLSLTVVASTVENSAFEYCFAKIARCLADWEDRLAQQAAELAAAARAKVQAAETAELAAAAAEKRAASWEAKAKQLDRALKKLAERQKAQDAEKRANHPSSAAAAAAAMDYPVLDPDEAAADRIPPTLNPVAQAFLKRMLATKQRSEERRRQAADSVRSEFAKKMTSRLQAENLVGPAGDASNGEEEGGAAPCTPASPLSGPAVSAFKTKGHSDVPQSPALPVPGALKRLPGSRQQKTGSSHPPSSALGSTLPPDKKEAPPDLPPPDPPVASFFASLGSDCVSASLFQG